MMSLLLWLPGPFFLPGDFCAWSQGVSVWGKGVSVNYGFCIGVSGKGVSGKGVMGVSI